MQRFGSSESSSTSRSTLSTPSRRSSLSAVPLEPEASLSLLFRLLPGVVRSIDKMLYLI